MPSQYFNLYNNASIRAALEASLNDGTIIPGAAEFVDVPGKNVLPAPRRRWPPTMTSGRLHPCLSRLDSYADAKVGQVLDALRRSPLAAIPRS